MMKNKKEFVYIVYIENETFEFTDENTAVRFAEVAKYNSTNKDIKVGVRVELK